MNFAWELIKVTFYLFLVIGVIYLLAYFYKNRFFQQHQGQNMQLIEQISLAPKKGLSLVKIKDRIMLFAVSENKVEKIQEWNSDEFELNYSSSGDSSFKSYLNKFWGSYRDGRNG